MQTTAVRELSTRTLAVADRFPFWADVVSQALVSLECDAPDRARFSGSIRHRHIGALSVADVQASAMKASRTRTTITHAPSDDIVVAVHIAGQCHVGQGSRLVTMMANAGAAVRTHASYYFEFSDAFRQIVIKLPRQLRCDAGIGVHGGDVLCLSPHASKLVGRLAIATLEDSDELSREEQDGIESAFADLVRSSLSAGVDNSEPFVPHLDSALEFIRSNLADAALRPTAVAVHLRMSQRSLARSFAQLGTTIDRTIWRERLEAARRELSEPALRDRSITEIAFGCGFNDLSHFTRSFSRQYRLSPRLYRAEQQRLWTLRRK